MTPLPTIEAAVRRFERRRRRVAVLRAVLLSVAAAALWMLAAMLVDRWLGLPRGLRVIALAVTGLIVLVPIWRAVRLAVTAIDVSRSATRIEAADASWGERLTTVLTQAALPPDRRGSAALNQALAEGVAGDIAARPPDRLVTMRPVWRGLALLGVVVLFWVISHAVPWLQMPQLLARHAKPWAALPKVTSTRIELQPHAASVAQGQSLEVVAELINGVGPVVLHVGPDADHLRRLPMERGLPNTYTTTLLALQDDIVYRVTAGDAAAGPVTVRVMRRPGVTRIDIDLTFPDGRPALTLTESDGNLRVPAGTQVALRFRVTEPLRRATVHVGDETVVATPATADGKTWSATFVAKSSADWSIDLLSQSQYPGSGPAGMRVLIDAPAAR